MFYRRLDRQPRAARRYRLQQETVDVAAVDQVHQHFAVVAATCDDRDQSRSLLAQLLGEFFDVRADHRGVGNQYTDLVVVYEIFGLRRRDRVMNVVQAPGRIPYRCQELVVPRHHHQVDLARACVSSKVDLLRLQCRHPACAVADDVGAVFRRLHDNLFGNRFVEIGGCIVCGFSNC